MSNLPNDQAGIGGQIGGDAHIYNDDTRAGLTSEDVDGRAAVQEVQHHLRRNVLRICADTLCHHAVVTSHHQHGFIMQTRQWLAGHPGDADGKLLEPAEAAARLGEKVLPTGCRLHGGFVQRPYPCDQIIKFQNCLIHQNRACCDILQN